MKPSNSVSVILGITLALPFENPDHLELAFASYTPPAGQEQNAGIFWLGTVHTPADFITYFGDTGGWNYTQLVTTYRVWNKPSSTHTWSLNGFHVLDKSFGYTPDVPADGYLNDVSDSPIHGFAHSAGVRSVGVLDSFRTYSMYHPPLYDSVYVPLKEWEWFWQGSAQFDAPQNKWIVLNRSEGWSFLDDFPPHPLWTTNITFGAITPPL